MLGIILYAFCYILVFIRPVTTASIDISSPWWWWTIGCMNSWTGGLAGYRPCHSLDHHCFGPTWWYVCFVFCPVAMDWHDTWLEVNTITTALSQFRRFQYWTGVVDWHANFLVQTQRFSDDVNIGLALSIDLRVGLMWMAHYSWNGR